MVSDSDFVHRFEVGAGEATLLLLHGTGGTETDLLPIGRRLAPDAALLSPRGKVLENGMPRFFRREAPGILDLEDLKLRTDEMAGFVAWAIAEYDLNRDRITAVGFSNGANLAVSLLFEHPKLLAGACLLRPMLPYPPPEGLDLTGRSVFIAAGANDQMVSPEDAPQLAQAMSIAGAEVELRVDPGAGHGLTENDLATAGNWLNK